MCGIAGQLGELEHGFAGHALDLLKHRGPDGSGVWQAEEVELVHTRLAILDLSGAGSQPMAWFGSEGGGQCVGFPSAARDFAHPLAVLVFNGEIYNFQRLRDDLVAAGERFIGNSDTEVLLRLLVREGAECLPKLEGMFAFAYWDTTKREALLARDAYGIKPLYYRSGSRGLQFASEYRVLKQPGDPLDAEALRDFFLWGSVPEPATLSRGIRQVPAGHVLTWKDGAAATTAWYRPPFHRQQPNRSGSAATRVREALLHSVGRHLVSDVPVGIFLSGGIDSTVLLAAARELLGSDADLRTFSIGFEDPGLDESGLARRTADRFGANHTEWRMNDEEGAAEVEAFLAAVDQPGNDGFNTWCVSKLASRCGMKVVLSGLGGDELLGGYQSFRQVPRFRLAHRLLGPLRPVAGWAAERCAPGSRWRRTGPFLRGSGSWTEAFHVQRGIFTPDEAARLVEHMTGLKPHPDWQGEPCPHGLEGREAVGWLELSRYMRNQLLRDSDVYSMAHGLELRVPFVDVRLIESLFEIPASSRYRDGKVLLVEAFPELPEWVRNRPKQGFVFPFEKWMKGRFGGQLGTVGRISPVALRTWYRTWCVAAARRHVGEASGQQ